MPNYYELVESRRERARRIHRADDARPHRSRSADHWLAAIAGGILVAVPVAAGLYRGSVGWMEVIVVLMGLASLATAVQGFARDSTRRSSAGVSRARPDSYAGCAPAGK